MEVIHIYIITFATKPYLAIFNNKTHGRIIDMLKIAINSITLISEIIYKCGFNARVE